MATDSATGKRETTRTILAFTVGIGALASLLVVSAYLLWPTPKPVTVYRTPEEKLEFVIRQATILCLSGETTTTHAAAAAYTTTEAAAAHMATTEAAAAHVPTATEPATTTEPAAAMTTATAATTMTTAATAAAAMTTAASTTAKRQGVAGQCHRGTKRQHNTRDVNCLHVGLH